MYAYIIQVTSGIAVAWLIYRFALRNRASATTNRYFLLGGLFLPFILPLVPMSPETVSLAEPILLPAIEIGASTTPSTEVAKGTNWLFFIYVGGVLSMLMYHLSGLFYFLKAIRNASPSESNSRVFEMANGNMPFSFFGRVFLPANLIQEDKKMIIGHEQLHIQRKHSWDVIIGAVVQSVLWFFPLLPFYMRDLREEHEFEVDQLMLENTTLSDYAETLLQFNLKPIHHRLFHSFSSPNLKTRIIMMTKNQKKNTWKLLLLVPVVGSLLYLNACAKQANDVVVPGQLNEESVSSKTSVTVNGTEVYAFEDVSSPPQFKSCETDESFDDQKACFFKGTMQHIQENLTFPEASKKEGVSGSVYVEYVISEKGRVIEAYIKKGIPNEENSEGIEAANKAALDVFGTFPEMVPAMKDGKPVAIKFVLPIKFQLS